MNDRFGHELNIGDEVACTIPGHGDVGLARGTVVAFVRNDVIVELMRGQVSGVAPSQTLQRISKRGNSVAKNLLPAPPDHLRDAFFEAFSQYLLLVQLSKEKIQ